MRLSLPLTAEVPHLCLSWILQSWLWEENLQLGEQLTNRTTLSFSSDFLTASLSLSPPHCLFGFQPLQPCSAVQSGKLEALSLRLCLARGATRLGCGEREGSEARVPLQLPCLFHLECGHRMEMQWLSLRIAKNWEKSGYLLWTSCHV